MHKLFADHSDRIGPAVGTFKQRKSLATRKEEVENIRKKFPTKIPVIVERYHKESQLSLLDKTKFLVPQELTVSQFLTIIRNRMHLGPNQAFYLLINNRSIASMSKTVAEVYLESKDEDGFLYVTYASQEMFGTPSEEKTADLIPSKAEQVYYKINVSKVILGDMHCQMEKKMFQRLFSFSESSTSDFLAQMLPF